MKVIVDYDLCEANAKCAGLVPQVFDVDDEDNLHILVDEVPPELTEVVKKAVEACPRTALRLAD
jgi:ferredoxin